MKQHPGSQGNNHHPVKSFHYLVQFISREIGKTLKLLLTCHSGEGVWLQALTLKCQILASVCFPIESDSNQNRLLWGSLIQLLLAWLKHTL